MPRITYTNTICQESNCTDQARARNWCMKHYLNKYRNQAVQCKTDGCQSRWLSKKVGYCARHSKDPNAPIGYVTRVGTAWDTDRLKQQVTVNEAGCWVWQGSTARGYGQVDAWVDGSRIKSAHRLSYVLANGEIEEGMQVHHKCAIRLCVNPDHLQLVTLESNIAEMHQRNKFLKQIGEQAMEISRLREENQALLTLLTQQTLATGREALTV
jgi:hypothetical protein